MCIPTFRMPTYRQGMASYSADYCASSLISITPTCIFLFLDVVIAFYYLFEKSTLPMEGFDGPQVLGFHFHYWKPKCFYGGMYWALYKFFLVWTCISQCFCFLWLVWDVFDVTMSWPTDKLYVAAVGSFFVTDTDCYSPLGYVFYGKGQNLHKWICTTLLFVSSGSQWHVHY